MTVRIKPHHFMDIIKLYGKGIEHFVPDEKMGHDFYRIANQILQDHSTLLTLTTGGDAICKPCKSYSDHCVDPLYGIDGFKDKNTYNRTLDERMIQLYSLDTKKEYTAEDLCRIYLQNASFIYQIWKEEDDAVTEKRYTWFVSGTEKYLRNF